MNTNKSEYKYNSKLQKKRIVNRKSRNRSGLLFVAQKIVILSLLLPFLLVGFNLLLELLKDPSILSEVISVRRFGIIVKTVFFSFSVAEVGVFLGFYTALSLFYVFKRKRIILLIVACFMMIPPYIHAFFWMKFVWYVFGQAAVSGIGISIVVQTIYFLPLCVGVWYIFFETIAPEYFYEASLNRTEEKSKSIVFFELGKGIGALLLILVGMLSMADYTIPSIFAFNTYPVEIMSIFSSYYELTLPVLASLPIFVISIGLVAFVLKLIRPDRFQLDQLHFQDEKLDGYLTNRPSKLKYLMCTAAIGIYVLIPTVLVVIDLSAMISSIQLLTNIFNDGLFSILTSTAAATLILFIAFFLNYYRYILNKKNSSMIFFMVLVVAMTGTIVGLIVNGFYQSLTYLINSMQSFSFTMIPTAHVFLLRFLPIGFFILLFGFSQLDRSLLDALRLETNGMIETIRYCIFPSIRKYIVLAWFSCFMFSFGELSGAMMVVPPGKSTLSVTIYNYLHYGSTEFVSLLCIVIVLLTFITGASLLYINKRMNKHRRGTFLKNIK